MQRRSLLAFAAALMALRVLPASTVRQDRAGVLLTRDAVQSNTRGTVAFAFALPNGRTTQVFVNTGDNAATHDKEPFTPFGRVVSGMPHVDAITAEYGEGPGGIRAGKQDAFFEGGNAWLLRQFPRLDFIRRAIVLDR